MAWSHRQFLKAMALLLAAPAVLGARVARALERNKKAFDARSPKDVLAALNAATAAESKSIVLRVPDVAADGDQVEVQVASKIPKTELISLLVHGNAQRLALSVAILPGAEPALSTVLHLRKTSVVTVVVQADGKTFRVAREVKVATALPCDRAS